MKKRKKERNIVIDKRQKVVWSREHFFTCACKFIFNLSIENLFKRKDDSDFKRRLFSARLRHVTLVFVFVFNYFSDWEWVSMSGHHTSFTGRKRLPQPKMDLVRTTSLYGFKHNTLTLTHTSHIFGGNFWELLGVSQMGR